MAKRTNAQHGDRVVSTTTGETGTIIDVHAGTTKKGSSTANAVAYSVLLDHGPRACVTWPKTEAEWKPPTGKRTCQRCGADGHTPITCDRGDL